MLSAEFWFALLCFAVLMYVILDGFDLGLGILFPWFRDDNERALMISSVAHVWDGNETWLVFGGVILFAAFPSVYAQMLSGAYIPVIVMLIALVMRGAAFEYRFKSTTSSKWWDRAFGLGSSVAGFCQGFILGNVVSGDFGLNLFCVLTGFAVMAGYALLGCGWMVIKKETLMQIRALKLAKGLVIVVLSAFCAICLYNLYLTEELFARWFSWPEVLYLAPLPVLAIALGCWIYLHCDYLIDGLQTKVDSHKLPLRLLFILTVLLFLLGFIGLLVGLYPFMLPQQITLYQALAPTSSLAFVAPGVLVLLPIILAYTLYGYHVFSGKVQSTY